MVKVKIPEPFSLVPFFTEDDEICIEPSMKFEEILEIDPLLFDICAYLNVTCLKPWEEKDRYIPIILEHWSITEPIISEFFQGRDRASAMKPMKQMTKLFLAFLFWANEQPVPNLKNIIAEIGELKIKPVNIEERITYILSAPNHYHAFIQLKELFIELKKKYAISRLK
jgi:hypothetical protein